MRYLKKFLNHFKKEHRPLPEEKLYVQINQSDISEIISTNAVNVSLLTPIRNQILLFLKERNINRRCYIEDDTLFAHAAIPRDYDHALNKYREGLESLKVLVVDNKPKFGSDQPVTKNYLCILPLEDEWFICRVFLYFKNSGPMSRSELIFKCDSLDGVFQLIIDYKI